MQSQRLVLPSCLECYLVAGRSKVMFHGPVHQALPFFEKQLGFVCPVRKDAASFLQEVTTPKGTRMFHLMIFQKQAVVTISLPYHIVLTVSCHPCRPADVCNSGAAEEEGAGATAAVGQRPVCSSGGVSGEALHSSSLHPSAPRNNAVRCWHFDRYILCQSSECQQA